MIDLCSTKFISSYTLLLGEDLGVLSVTKTIGFTDRSVRLKNLAHHHVIHRLFFTHYHLPNSNSIRISPCRIGRHYPNHHSSRYRHRIRRLRSLSSGQSTPHSIPQTSSKSKKRWNSSTSSMAGSRRVFRLVTWIWSSRSRDR